MGFTAKDKEWIEEQNEALEKALSKKFELELAKKLEESVGEMKKEIVELKDENLKMREKLIEHDIRMDDIEQYGRRMAIRVEGILWKEGESNADLEKKLTKEFAKSGVTITSNDVIRLHRSSRPKEKDGKVTKQAIVKFASWTAREKFAGFNKKARAFELRTGKASIRVNNDLTKRRLVLLTEARNIIKGRMMRTYTPEQMKDLPDNENVFAYSNINSELRMRVRGKVLKFNNIPELRVCVAEAFPDVAVVA